MRKSESTCSIVGVDFYYKNNNERIELRRRQRKSGFEN